MTRKSFLVLFGLLPITAHASWFDKSPPVPSFADLAKQVKPAVVNIQTTKRIQRRDFPWPRSPFGGPDPFEEFRRFFEDAVPREETRSSLGSGFIINEKGDILTNNHVVGDADEIVAKLADGREFKAKVVGRDERTDLAVIKIKAKDTLPAAKLGDSDQVEPGDWVMAVGNPFGFAHTVTVGVVSAKGRLIGDANAPMAKFIQTDASINPGNSGGPLFDLQGEVIGINTMIYGMGTGIGFAIPINLAKSLVPQLIAEGHVTRGWLGVQIQPLDPELAESFGVKGEKGALVADVFPDSPAEQAGLKRGDVVLELDGKPIEDVYDLTTQVGETAVGKTVTLKVLRDGKQTLTLKTKIGQRREEAMAAPDRPVEKMGDADRLGLVVRNFTPRERKQLGAEGIMIERVEPGAPAEDYDIRSGDILYEVNGTAVNDVETYAKTIEGLKKGSLVRLLFRRGPATIFRAFRLEK